MQYSTGCSGGKHAAIGLCSSVDIFPAGLSFFGSPMDESGFGSLVHRVYGVWRSDQLFSSSYLNYQRIKTIWTIKIIIESQVFGFQHACASVHKAVQMDNEERFW